MCPAFFLGANTNGLHAIRKISSRSKARAKGAWDNWVLLVSVVDRLLHDLPFALSHVVKRARLDPHILMPLVPPVRDIRHRVPSTPRRSVPSCLP
jgi:hypothetical protein